MKQARCLVAVLSVLTLGFVLAACGNQERQTATVAAQGTHSARAWNDLPAKPSDSSAKTAGSAADRSAERATSPSVAASDRKDAPDGRPENVVGPQPASAAPDAPAVPAELQHDAYRYLGLGNANPVAMTLTGMADGSVMSSVQTNTLKEVKDGTAVFVSDSVINGTIRTKREYTVTKEGVFVREPAAGSAGERQMELPAGLTPGRTWKAIEKHVAADKTFTTDTTSRVIGLREVQTARGKFMALVVEEKGTMRQGAVDSPIVSKMWLVKDIGPVRNELTMRTPNAKKPVLIVGVIQ